MPHPIATGQRAEARAIRQPPVAKTTLPLAMQKGLEPTTLLQLSSSHYFFDFGQERMGGLTLTVPASTVAAWGGAGTVVEIILSEQLSRFNKHAILYPGLNPGCLECTPIIPNWNKIPKIISRFTLADGDFTFEHHEYLGLWRYGELRVKKSSQALPQPDLPSATRHSASHNFSLTAWAVMYPSEGTATFASDDPMLDAVWRLCYDTIRFTSLDTSTDSNVRC